MPAEILGFQCCDTGKGEIDPLFPSSRLRGANAAKSTLGVRKRKKRGTGTSTTMCNTGFIGRGGMGS